MTKLIQLDDLDEAIIGVLHRGASNPTLCYSKDKIIEILMRDDMSEEDAVDYFDFNILQLWAGEGTPYFLYEMEPEEAIEWAADLNQGGDE